MLQYVQYNIEKIENTIIAIPAIGERNEIFEPLAERLQKAFSLLEVEKSEARYVRDSVVDVDVATGIQANVYSIGVQWLPEYLTSGFSKQPSLIIKSVMESKNSFKVGGL